jgi:hypothetical protein
MIHYFHLMLGSLEKLRFAEFLKAGMPRHGKIGTIELQNKPALTIASYSTCMASPIAST